MSVPLATDGLVSVEFAMLLMVSIFFSMLYETDMKTESGILATVCWFSLGAYYFVVFRSEVSNILSILFMGVGLVYGIRWFMDVVSSRDVISILEDAEV